MGMGLGGGAGDVAIHAELCGVFVGVTPGCRGHGQGRGERFGHGNMRTAWSGELLTLAAMGKDGDRDGDAAPAGSLGLVLRM